MSLKVSQSPVLKRLWFYFLFVGCFLFGKRHREKKGLERRFLDHKKLLLKEEGGKGWGKPGMSRKFPSLPFFQIFSLNNAVSFRVLKTFSP